MLNYYKILEIPDFSDTKIIKQAYRNLSKKYHPDINSDANASDYFILINEAYNFLMDENKRLLLHQFLKEQDVANSHSFQSFYQPPKPRFQPPVVHFFFCDKAYYTLHDFLFLQWSVSHCKSVHISLFGNVANEGSEYFYIENFSESICILLTMIGLDGNVYTYEIEVYYQEEDPQKRAFHQILREYPDAKFEHFAHESISNTIGRIGKNEFVNRLIFIGVILLISLVFYTQMQAKIVFFVVIAFLLYLVYAQGVKRWHDIAGNNFSVSHLFTQKGTNDANAYGIPPKDTHEKFYQWIGRFFQKNISQLRWFHLVGFGMFALILGIILFKSIRDYDEYPLDVQKIVVSAQGEYFLQLEDGSTISISQKDVLYLKDSPHSYLFFSGIDNSGHLHYVRVFHKKDFTSHKIFFGIYRNTDVFMVFVILLFVGQVFGTFSLSKPNEKPFATLILGFVLFINLIILLNL